MKKLFVFLAIFVLATTANAAGVEVELMGNVTLDSLPDGTKFLHQTEQVSCTDSTMALLSMVHELLKNALGAADWTVFASGRNIVFLQETKAGFIRLHLWSNSKIADEDQWLLAKTLINDEVGLGETINIAWDKWNIEHLSLYYQTIKEAGEMAQFKK